MPNWSFTNPKNWFTNKKTAAIILAGKNKKKKALPRGPAGYVPEWMRRSLQFNFTDVIEAVNQAGYEIKAGEFDLESGTLTLNGNTLDMPLTVTFIELSETNFTAHVYLMTQINHPFLEELVGYSHGVSPTTSNPIGVLVYERSANTLDVTFPQLDWPGRVKFISRIVKGLARLHELGHAHGRLDSTHFRVKPDEIPIPKVGGYCLYTNTGNDTGASEQRMTDTGNDTVACGRLIVLILTGKNLVGNLFTDRHHLQVEDYPADSSMPMLPEFLEQSNEYKQMLRVASECFHEKPENRYTMYQILDTLQRANLSQGDPP